MRQIKYHQRDVHLDTANNMNASFGEDARSNRCINCRHTLTCRTKMAEDVTVLKFVVGFEPERDSLDRAGHCITTVPLYQK